MLQPLGNVSPSNFSSSKRRPVLPKVDSMALVAIGVFAADGDSLMGGAAASGEATGDATTGAAAVDGTVAGDFLRACRIDLATCFAKTFEPSSVKWALRG